MKSTARIGRKVIIIVAILSPVLALAQGEFLFSNFNAPTRVGLTNGPLAGRGYWAQMLAGLTTDSLIPVDAPVEHFSNGIASHGVVAVPSIAPGSFGFVQMVAWDGRLWGTSLSGVPPDQLGRTDIVRQYFSYDFQPAAAPDFKMPAVVPVPEPSILKLAILGAGALWFSRRFRKRR